ncbi:hypothetical protein RND81_08G011500 [Saponaria officinalis]|uniref:F-box associated beta-propeller type 3 domain-containing protein n=1 Tax=Saponaria officinalis TaxID=3572 RepID=A0AAW1J451_SAPOF
MSPKFRELEQYVAFNDTAEIVIGGDSGLQVCHTSICPFDTYVGFPFRSHVVGCVHGLLCLSESAEIRNKCRVMLWNPMFRKYINLPVSSTGTDMGITTSVLGFGYDGIRNDHRVVKITDCHGVDELLIEVYSVREHTWKTISSEFLIDNSIKTVSYLHHFHNGVIHWLTLKSRTDYKFDKWLISFNVAEETFEKLELPEGMVNASTLGPCVCLFEFQTKLAVSRCRDSSDINAQDRCRIWVKTKDDASNCWCIILDIVIHRGFYVVSDLYFRRTGELLGFAKLDNKKVISVDPLTLRVTNVGILNLDMSTMFCNYTESLVLLDRNTEVYTDDDLRRLLLQQYGGIHLLFVTIIPTEY